jgi:hypothetical protein
MKILGIHPCTRHYAQIPEINWFEWQQDPMPQIPILFNTENLKARSDVVSVDMSQADVEELHDLLEQHSASLQDPVVQDAWRQYRTVLRLRGFGGLHP